MSGFGGFGAPSTGAGFGAAKPPDQPSSGFTIPTTTTTTTVSTTTGATFGTPGTTGLFGVQNQTPTGFGIKPITTTAAGLTGFKFGTSTTNTTGTTFGVPSANTTPSFGIPAVNTVTPTFGIPATSTTIPSFNTLGTQNTPTFGTLTFNSGVPKTTANAGLTLPSTSSAATTPAAPSFNFGVMSSAPTTSAPLSFGISTTATTTNTNTSAPTLSFGVPAAGASTTTTTATTGFTFTQPSATSSLTFGAPKTTGGFTFNSSTTKTLTFNLGTSTTTAPTFSAGLFGTPKTTENASITTTATTSAGLGGVDYTQTTQGLSGPGTMELKHAKDHNLPDPILQTLNDFQNFTKQQKSISVEISHGSSKPLKKVQEDTEAIESLLTTIASGLTKNAIAVDKLKTETAQGLHQAEMAQRNHETPPGLDYDNSAPSDYFNDLVTKFETDTVRLRVQIEASEKHLRSLTQCSTISPQELTLAMRRLHETLIVLAARVQGLHTTVQSQKEQFKNLRRVYFKDETNIFDSETDPSNRVKKQTIYSLRSLTGPTPFSETTGSGLPMNLDGLAMLANSATDANQATASNPSWISPLQRSPNAGFSTPGLSTPFPNVDVSGFQLSKPPTGNKRSKR